MSDFYAVMGDILHQQGQAEEAFAAYDSCLVWKEDNIGCLNNYAYYLSELGEQLERDGIRLTDGGSLDEIYQLYFEKAGGEDHEHDH